MSKSVITPPLTVGGRSDSTVLFRPLTWVVLGIASLLLLLIPAVSLAQEVVSLPLEQAAPSHLPRSVNAPHEIYDSGGVAWMLTSSALVLFMLPGLALFFGGMVRSKNVLNTFLLCMAPIGLIGLQWVIIGYAIAFPTVTEANVLVSGGVNAEKAGAIISWLAFDPSLAFLRIFDSAGFGRTVSTADTAGAVSTHVPELVFVMFQGKFAIIAPALIVGAVVERVKFGPMLLFMLLWSTFIYAPVAHWVWNVNGWLFQHGALDYAGGTVVHILGGFSALALCYVVGPRRGYGKVAMPPHSLGLTLIGAGMLWFGWFGFNAGSTIAVPGSDLALTGGVSGAIAGLAFTNTQIAAAAAAVAWMFTEWKYSGKPTILGFASGMVSGLVAITPAAGFVLPWHAMLIGAAGGVVCFFACKIKHLIKADDSLDTFGVHGIGGLLGALLVGVFAFRGLSDHLLLKQLLACVVAIVFAFAGTLVIAYAIHKTLGLRVSEQTEDAGLDLALHGEKGYHFDHPDQPLSTLPQTLTAPTPSIPPNRGLATCTDNSAATPSSILSISSSPTAH